MTLLQFWLMLGFGLVGSIHCVQMCGPIVLSYSLPMAGTPRMWRAHVWYNLGRITTYSVLGALAGAAGGAIGLAGRLAGIAHGGRILAGAAMIAAGIYLLGLARPASLVRIDRPGIAARLARFGKRFMLSVNPSSKFRLGLAFGFLPCGLIYAALLKAVDAGTASGGALTMLAFGLGTSAALAATGLASTAFGWRLGRWSNALAGVSIMLAGALLVWRGIAPGGAMHHHGHF
ncbi:MAG TPA: sulfite exporter TauE/SafE family protein [Bryobacteraceae bacterium]|nr:sulfite exporter TauE/SafE family protein [Bryobacteraceae bacterium]